jgi:hypothetical protein
MRRHLIPFLITICIISLVSYGWSRSGSYMGQRTGAPGEGNCTNCHTGVLNSGSGSVGLSAPPEYTPGDTLDLSVSLANVGQSRWGFEITALDASDQPAGQFLISDATNTQMNIDNRQYVFHTSTGTYDGTADASPGWTFRWVAPPQGSGTVTFWLAGLASNSSNNTSGDSTYTTSEQVNEAVIVDVDDQTDPNLPEDFELGQNYPNPFNPETQIEFSLPRATHVTLQVYNILGERVRMLVDDYLPAGNTKVAWDGKDDDGLDVASGIYLYQIKTGASVASKKMTLLR